MTVPLETDLQIRLDLPSSSDDELSCLPLWSARCCVQTLTPLPGPPLRRTVDGRLISLVPPSHQKYTSTIQCKDKKSIALDGLWCGAKLWVDCIQRITMPLPQGIERARMSRPAVPESIAFERPHEEIIWLREIETQVVLFPEPTPAHSFLSYRPQLHMRLKSFQFQTDEWDLVVGWKMDLEEI